jgi:hypothetical protein
MRSRPSFRQRSKEAGNVTNLPEPELLSEEVQGGQSKKEELQAETHSPKPTARMRRSKRSQVPSQPYPARTGHVEAKTMLV